MDNKYKAMMAQMLKCKAEVERAAAMPASKRPPKLLEIQQRASLGSVVSVGGKR